MDSQGHKRIMQNTLSMYNEALQRHGLQQQISDANGGRREFKKAGGYSGYQSQSELCGLNPGFLEKMAGDPCDSTRVLGTDLGTCHIACFCVVAWSFCIGLIFR